MLFRWPRGRFVMQHVDVWRGVDLLAKKHGLSASGLAKLAGLDATAFNKSKRQSKDGRPRWPSTESIARALDAVGEEFSDFADLVSGQAGISLPVLDLPDDDAQSHFSKTGRPNGQSWPRVHFPGRAFDAEAFALDVVDHSLAPTYRLGDRLVVSPHAETQIGDRVVIMSSGRNLVIGELGRSAERYIEIRPLADDAPALILNKNELTWMARILWVSQ